MYKVFINEKSLTISKYPLEIDKNLRYEGFATLEIGIDLLENTSCKELNIFGEETDEIWEDFTHMLKVVEAAGGIVHNKQNEILFINRLNRWDLPKGKIEHGESLEAAAVREVEEECNITELIIDKFINSTFHIYREKPDTRVLKTTYWFKMHYVGDKTPQPQLEEGITEVKWIAPNKVAEEVFPTTFKNIQLILNELWESEP